MTNHARCLCNCQPETCCAEWSGAPSSILVSLLNLGYEQDVVACSGCTVSNFTGAGSVGSPSTIGVGAGTFLEQIQFTYNIVDMVFDLESFSSRGQTCYRYVAKPLGTGQTGTMDWTWTNAIYAGCDGALEISEETLVSTGSVDLDASFPSGLDIVIDDPPQYYSRITTGFDEESGDCIGTLEIRFIVGTDGTWSDITCEGCFGDQQGPSPGFSFDVYVRATSNTFANGSMPDPDTLTWTIVDSVINLVEVAVPVCEDGDECGGFPCGPSTNFLGLAACSTNGPVTATNSGLKVIPNAFSMVVS